MPESRSQQQLVEATFVESRLRSADGEAVDSFAIAVPQVSTETFRGTVHNWPNAQDGAVTEFEVFGPWSEEATSSLTLPAKHGKHGDIRSWSATNSQEFYDEPLDCEVGVLASITHNLDSGDKKELLEYVALATARTLEGSRSTSIQIESGQELANGNNIANNYGITSKALPEQYLFGQVNSTVGNDGKLVAAELKVSGPWPEGPDAPDYMFNSRPNVEARLKLTGNDANFVNKRLRTMGGAVVAMLKEM